MSLWTLFSGLFQSKRAMDQEVLSKRARREGAHLNADEFARLDEVIRKGNRATAIATHREMSGSGPEGARIAVERRAEELGVSLDD